MRTTILGPALLAAVATGCHAPPAAPRPIAAPPARVQARRPVYDANRGVHIRGPFSPGLPPAERANRARAVQLVPELVESGAIED